MQEPMTVCSSVRPTYIFAVHYFYECWRGCSLEKVHNVICSRCDVDTPVFEMFCAGRTYVTEDSDDTMFSNSWRGSVEKKRLYLLIHLNFVHQVLSTLDLQMAIHTTLSKSISLESCTNCSNLLSNILGKATLHYFGKAGKRFSLTYLRGGPRHASQK